MTPRDPESLLAGFVAEGNPSVESYGRLFLYFVQGFLAYRSRMGASARYPGMSSSNGPAMDRLEGFSRVAPLIAAWLHGGRPSNVTPEGDAPIDLLALLRAGIVAGTNPASPEYWGDVRHWQQSIVEAADVALTLWLARKELWDGLSAAEQARAARWLAGVNGKGIPDNNWHLFVAQVNAVLAALDQPSDPAEMQRHYLRAKEFYRGAGWFEDGNIPGRPGFDYYNAWGFHYPLQWLKRIAPDLDSSFIDAAMAEFAADYKHFFGPSGFPIMGRSVCYRMAAPVPLVFAQVDHPLVVTPGEARRALDVTWQYFIRRGALAGGNVTQGYFKADPRLLENYSGPASCLWSLRSLIAAFSLPPDSAFWRAAPEPLPVELGDFELRLPEPDWVLIGNRSAGSIAIRTGRHHDAPLERYRIVDRLLELATRKPRRPKNNAAKYERSHYDSAHPFCDES